MGQVVIGAEGGTSAVVRDVYLDDEGFGGFVIELHGAGLDVANGVTTFDATSGNLDHYFQDVADAWRGWSGTKTWDSVEDDLTVECWRSGGQNALRFTARCGHPPTWTATLELSFEPGQQAATIAAELRAVFDAARTEGAR